MHAAEPHASAYDFVKGLVDGVPSTGTEVPVTGLFSQHEPSRCALLARKRAASWVVVPLILAIVLPQLIPAVMSDGLIVDPWGMPFQEGAQTAFVFCNAGLESLVIYVSSYATEGSYWLIPVWSAPENIVVSHVNSLALDGYDWGIDAWTSVKSTSTQWFVGGSLASQLYPALSPLSLVLLDRFDISRPPIYIPMLGTMDQAANNRSGVAVHEVIESFSLTSYIVTATDANSLYQFLGDIGVNVSDEVRAVLEGYLSGQAGYAPSMAMSPSFVVSKVSRRSIREDGQPFNMTPPMNMSSPIADANITRIIYMPPQGLGIIVTFPSDAPFYPLIPTSIYGSEIVPLRLYVNGLWDTQYLPETLSAFTKVEHFVDGHISVSTYPEVKPVSGTELSEYTLITMDAPSKYLTSDLVFQPAALVQAAVEFSWAIGILAFLICSVVASGLASLLLGSRGK
ncbi:MAG TPA: hypothetical protein VEG31_03760, partial [Thermoproteota archaeon]|nr:hypothetical protein [Thermoproteota archaeon]